MINNLSRQELIELVRDIMNCEYEGVENEEEEQTRLINLLKQNVLDPQVSGYIFWPHNYTDTPREMTPEEIVDKALSYKPIIL